MTSTHVAVIWPWVQPVVRPTLFTTFPTIDGPSLTMRNWPEIVRDPVFTPVVFPDQGFIAKTTGGNTGSLTISGQIRIVSEGPSIVGNVVHKVGRTTGGTQGQVTAAGVEIG